MNARELDKTIIGALVQLEVAWEIMLLNAESKSEEVAWVLNQYDGTGFIEKMHEERLAPEQSKEVWHKVRKEMRKIEKIPGYQAKCERRFERWKYKMEYLAEVYKR